MGDRSALTVTIHAAEPAALATIHDLFDEHALGEWGGPNADAPNGEKVALGWGYGASECHLGTAEEVAAALAEFPGVVADCQQDPCYEYPGYSILVANGKTREVPAESQGDQYVTVEALDNIITNGVLDYAAYRQLTGADFTDLIRNATEARKAQHGDAVVWLPLPADEGE